MQPCNTAHARTKFMKTHHTLYTRTNKEYKPEYVMFIILVSAFFCRLDEFAGHGWQQIFVYWFSRCNLIHVFYYYRSWPTPCCFRTCVFLSCSRIAPLIFWSCALLSYYWFEPTIFWGCHYYFFMPGSRHFGRHAHYYYYLHA